MSIFTVLISKIMPVTDGVETYKIPGIWSKLIQSKLFCVLRAFRRSLRRQNFISGKLDMPGTKGLNV